MKTCPLCSEQILDNRLLCRECLKEKQWDDIKWGEANRIFPPRIVNTLITLDGLIKLDEKDFKIKSGLFLHGQAGAGKTIYAAAVLMELKRQSFLSNHLDYIKGRFINVMNLLEDIRDSFNVGNAGTCQNIIDLYSNIDVLILDDIGCQKVTDWVLNTLLLLINNRYENLKITIFTSNSDLNALAYQYGDNRIPSRIVEMCRIKHFTNKDYRIGG
jgi:DNA replication protein DnaC